MTNKENSRSLSLKDSFLSMSKEKQQEFINSTPEHELEALLNSWNWTARSNQLPPDDYSTWLLLAGRGFG